MIKELKRIEKSIVLELLNSPSKWNSLYVDYEKPYVERVWTQFGTHRISLHVIEPCTEEESLIHPHIWKGAFHVFPNTQESVYQHSLYINTGFDTDDDRDNNYECICTQEIKGKMYYEMLSENSIHSVTPINEPAYSIMLSGPVIWENNKTSVTKKMLPLSDERKQSIINIFKHKLKYGN